MSLATLLLFLPACFALNLAPGPNNLLSISNATRYGFRTACVAGIGRLLAFAVMIALAATGLAVVLQGSVLLFTAIKLAGAGYLFGGGSRKAAAEYRQAPQGGLLGATEELPGVLENRRD